jgi:excisionase family DNA binding protein
VELARDRTLSPRDLADALGVSESSVKRWIDAGRIAAARTAGGHRRVALADALRFVRATRLPVRDGAALGLPALDAAPAFDGAPLREALLAADAPRVRGLLLRAYVEGEDLAALADGPLREAFAEVGGAWHEDFVRGVAAEHRATVALAEALALLRSLGVEPAAGAPAAVGGAPAGDPYLIPCALATLVLAGEGWQVENLGADVPLDVLVHRAEATGARLAWLSCSVPLREGYAGEVARAAEAMAARGATLVVGGRFSDPLAGLPHVRPGRTMADLRAIARGAAA